MKKKTYLALMMAFIIAITASSSYAYFNGKAIISRANGESLNTLTIQNGNEKISIDTGNANWIYNGVEGNEINDPTSRSSATYSGIKVSNESNLTSNVKLEFSFNSKKDGGSIEDENAKPPENTDEEDKREPAEKFEVLVGDIDRFNKGYGSTTNEQLFAGATIERTGLNIHPNNDAAGTDRRMVTSGFYNFYKNLSRSSERGDENSKIIIHTHYSSLHYWDYYNIDGEFVKWTTKWPGISPDKNSDGSYKRDENNLYVYTIKDIIFTNLVLNNGDNDKTGDLYITEGEWKYDANGWHKLEEGNWVHKSEIPKMTAPTVQTNSYIKDNANWAVDRKSNTINSSAAFYSFTYNDYSLENILYNGTYSIFREEKNIAGPLKTDNGEVFFDGYTDRAMRRMWEDGNSANNNEYIQDGVDWGTLQPVQPITFEYNNKIGEKKVTSAFIQMVINDIQAEATEADWEDKSKGGKQENSGWYTSFSGKSNVEYQVTLKIKGDDSSAVRVTEWENEINRLSQHDTVANLVLLEFPSRLLKMIEEAEGKGLELLIDDPRDGSEKNSNGALIVASGDSYAVDFAKLVVNETIPTDGLISGVIKDRDTDLPISGVKITCKGISEEATTNENGEFEFKLPAGQVILYLTHPQYVDREYAINISNGVTAKATIYMTKRENVNIIPKTKFEGYVTITKYKKHEHNNCSDDCKIEGTLVDSIEPDKVKFKIGEAGKNDNKTDVYTAFKVEPGYYYLLDYTVNLFTANEIDENTLEKFSVEFSSSIKATITQENNPGWSESGEQEETTQ